MVLGLLALLVWRQGARGREQEREQGARGKGQGAGQGQGQGAGSKGKGQGARGKGQGAGGRGQGARGRGQGRGKGQGGKGQGSSLITHHSSLIIGLALLFIIGAFFRFTHLGYSEFLTDEARTVLRAAAVIQGQEDVLFLHRKGPVEILLPTTIFALTGHIDEASARLPFAVANLTGLFAVFLLGWQLLGPLAGWIAAFLLAFDGYLIGFARFVQYQSVVFLTSILAVLVVYRLVRQPAALTRYLLLAALFFATGLLAHYDAALSVIPVGYLLFVLGQQKQVGWGKLLRAALPALLLGGGLLALFYLPFVRATHFQATYSYLVEQRIGSADVHFPYNNLGDFFKRSIVYNSTYAVMLMVVLVAVGLILAYRRGWKSRIGSAAGVGMALLLAMLSWRIDFFKIGATDFALVPFALIFVFIWLAPRLKVEERLLWLWFGAPLVLALFCTAFPGTHVYVFFVPWALLVGGVSAQGWEMLRRWTGEPMAHVAGSAAVSVVMVVFGLYAYWYFVYNRVEILRTWASNHPAIYWTPTNPTQMDRLYGFPLANGWKVIGALYAQGKLQGDYETNQRDNLIPDWYTRSQPRCAATANWYFAIDNLEPWAKSMEQVKDEVSQAGYKKWGVVKVNGSSRLVIYQRTNAKIKAQTFQLTDYAAAFDAQASATLPLHYPVIEDKIAHPLHINFANQIWLEGYDLSYQAPLKASAPFRLTLYWRAQRPLAQSYKVFNQAFYGNGVMVAQKDGYPVCDRYLTSDWYPGELITDIYDMQVAEDAPVGSYPLYTGMYLEQTQSRLSVLDAAGKAVDNQARVADLQIEAK
ncbi:MAG: glycosyltransferase family 39 protein [Caldilineaceae bacterium]